MARKELSEEQIDEVVKQRQRGASWLKIEKETGVSRRVAKRVYGDWEDRRTMDDLKTVRSNIVAQELSNHVKVLLRFAELLVSYLGVPTSPNENRSAEDVFETFLRQNIVDEPKEAQALSTMMDAPEIGRRAMEREKQRLTRQNKMLFKALREHTRMMRWEPLFEDWKAAWNTCREALMGLREDVREVITNIISQSPGLKTELEKAAGSVDVLQPMTEAVVRAVWRGEELAPFQTRAASGNRFIVTFAEGRQVLELTFSEHRLAEKAAEICNWAATNVLKRDAAEQIANMLNKVEEKVMALEEMLEPLVLRPMIIRSHCSLCPV